MVLSTIPDHFQIQYDSNLGIALQQETSLLRGAVMIKSGTGESIRFDELGDVETVDVTTRGGDTVYQDLDSSQRWVRPFPAESAVLRELLDLDHLGNLVGLDGGIVRAQCAAINRTYDRRIIAGMLGAAYTGKNGTDTVALDTTNMAVAVNYVASGAAANSGMTFYKIAAAEYKLDVNLVPTEGRYLAMSAKQRLDLRNDVIANHSDDSSALDWAKGGYLKGVPLMGFNIILVKPGTLPLLSTTRTCPFWQKDGVGFGIWTDKISFIDRMPGKRQATQFYAATNCGATRMDEKKVGVIYCDEA